MQYFLKNFEFGKTRMRWKFRATTQGRPYVVTNRLLARKAPLARPVRRLVPLPKKSHDFSGTPLGLCDINSALQSQQAAGCRPYI